MKKLTSFCACLLAAASLQMAAQDFVQGIDYSSTLEYYNTHRGKKTPPMKLGDILDTDTPKDLEGFSWDNIVNWTGHGPNRAALIIQWTNQYDEPRILTFGYRWTGQASGFDMLKAVVENNNQLYALVQGTNVSCDWSSTYPYGYTVDGLGWHISEGDESWIYDEKDYEQYFSETGLFYHPRGLDTSGSIDYDYDDWYSAEDTDWWEAGWYWRGYWSYWCRDAAEGPLGYSGWGISCRQLSNNSIDAWIWLPELYDVPLYQLENAPDNGWVPNELDVVPSDPEPQPVYTVDVDLDKVDFWVGEGANSAAVVIRWNDCVLGSSSYTCPLDNLVMGVHYDGELSADEIVAKAVDGNRRLQSSGAGNYGYDMRGVGGTLTAYDHNKTNDATNEWHIYTCNSGSVVCLDYQPVGESEPTDIPGCFYIPSDDKIGVFLPENTYFILRDNCHLFLPFYINAGEGGSCTKIATEADVAYKEYVSSAPMVITSSAASISKGNTTLRAHMNFLSGKTGSFVQSVTATINGSNYTATTNVTILPPRNPITALTISPEGPLEVHGYPNNNFATLTYTFQPADASFTKVVWSSTNQNIVSVTSAGKLSARGMQGTAQVLLSYAADPEVFASVDVNAYLDNLVTDIMWGDGSGVFDLEYMDILLVDPHMIPENADNKNFTYQIIGDPEIATTYTTKDIINHKPGTVEVKITALDGSNVSKTYTVNFHVPNRTPEPDEYQDGTFWLSEEWYTHTNGSINYITPEGDIKYRVYESQNPYESFGATSQYAIIYGGRMYVTSKQEKDPGDPRPGGGRLVVLDAKTLKKQASWQEYPAGGDTRACIGVTPEKLYVGTTAGIYVLTVDNDNDSFTLSDDIIPGTAGPSLYSGQPGDMACDGRYVYVVKQSTGIIVIDSQTDTVVETFALIDGNGNTDNNPEGIVRGYDGTIWIASKTYLYHLSVGSDEETGAPVFDISETYRFASPFPDSWMAWRSCNLFASHNENVLYFGSSTYFNAGCDKLYRWVVGKEFPTEPIFVGSESFPKFTMNGKEYQTYAYATGGYDSRSDEFLIAATYGSTTSARYTWYFFLDGTSGEVKRSIELKPYFWFPAMPVFPHASEPEIIGLDSIVVNGETLEVNEAHEIDLQEFVSDASIPFSWIKFDVTVSEHQPASQHANPAPRFAGGSHKDEVLTAEITDDGKLKITPIQNGSALVTINAEANGKTTTSEIPVTITGQLTGIANCIIRSESRIFANSNALTCKNMDGEIVTICDMNGRKIKAFRVDGDKFTVRLSLSPGVYAACSSNGVTSKMLVK